MSVQLTCLVSLVIQTPDNTDVPEPIANNCHDIPKRSRGASNDYQLDVHIHWFTFNVHHNSLPMQELRALCASLACINLKICSVGGHASSAYLICNVLCVSKGCMNLKSNPEKDVSSTRTPFFSETHLNCIFPTI